MQALASRAFKTSSLGSATRATETSTGGNRRRSCASSNPQTADHDSTTILDKLRDGLAAAKTTALSSVRRREG